MKWLKDVVMEWLNIFIGLIVSYNIKIKLKIIFRKFLIYTIILSKKEYRYIYIYINHQQVWYN